MDVKYSVEMPIASPPHRPTATQMNSCQLCTARVGSSAKMPVNVGGSASSDSASTAGVASVVDTISCCLRLDSISATTRAGRRSVARKVVPMQTTSPTAEMSSGKAIAAPECDAPSDETDESTSAAQVDSANEPNRSAPMPAMSPTLSPTLSAITAGLRGSSSGMPASTLPTRSAPTSAALVKMPPPRRAKIEISEAPKPSATRPSTMTRSPS